VLLIVETKTKQSQNKLDPPLWLVSVKVFLYGEVYIPICIYFGRAHTPQASSSFSQFLNSEGHRHHQHPSHRLCSLAVTLPPKSTLSTSGIHSPQDHTGQSCRISLPDVYFLQSRRHLLNIDQPVEPFSSTSRRKNACHNVKVRFSGAYFE
jgi:hypothetical protein